MRAVVLWRCLRASLTLGVVANTLRNGNAQRKFVQGSVTTRAIVIQRNQLVITERCFVERMLYRQCLLLLILRPQRRSKVSSITISTVPPARTNVSTSTCNNLLLTSSGDQRARLST